MNPETATLEEFLSQAVTVLRETEQKLQQLAQVTIFKYEQSLGQTETDPAAFAGGLASRLPQVSRQLVALSEQSRSLSFYLQNGLEAPPADEAQWPQIRILQSQEEERTKLARALENSVGQLLANAVFELASCRHLLESDHTAVSTGLEALQVELEQGLSSMRQLIADLEPATILGNFGLGAGIRRYLEQFELRTGLKTQLRINTNIGRLPNLIELAIFRVIREALDNVDRHAQATQVDVGVEEKDGRLEFSVIDNGVGVALEKVSGTRKSLGLVRMVDYAELLNGQLRVFSEPGRGTRIVLSMPYPAL
jgi:signal transduction histidine kinase